MKIWYSCLPYQIVYNILSTCDFCKLAQLSIRSPRPQKDFKTDFSQVANKWEMEGNVKFIQLLIVANQLIFDFLDVVLLVVWDFITMKRSLGATAKLLSCDLMITRSSNENNLLQRRVKLYNRPNAVQPFPETSHWQEIRALCC